MESEARRLDAGACLAGAECSHLSGSADCDSAGMRYRLDVLAANVSDVVEAAGGWLFDRRMAGWDVTVLVPESQDVRALRILGVDIVEVGSAWVPWSERPRVEGLAVAANLFDRDCHVKQGVFHALEQGLPEVVLWGQGWPEGLLRSDVEVRHKLSCAARMFKSYAVNAASGREIASGDQFEVFKCGTIESPSALLRRRRRRRMLRQDQTT